MCLVQAERGNDDASRTVQQLAGQLSHAATEEQRALLEQQMQAQVPDYTTITLG